MKYIKHILSETIYLLPYFCMTVSFLAVILPYFGYVFDGNFWCNLGGYSIFTNIMFIYVISMNKKYCLPTRMLPISMLIISLFNIVMSFFPEHYDTYSLMFEIFTFSVTLAVCLIIWFSILLKNIYGNYITH